MVLSGGSVSPNNEVHRKPLPKKGFTLEILFRFSTRIFFSAWHINMNDKKRIIIQINYPHHAMYTYLYIKTTKFEIFVSKILSSSEEAPSNIRFLVTLIWSDPPPRSVGELYKLLSESNNSKVHLVFGRFCHVLN